ncbi:MAG: HAD-IA family hydrolase [Gemmatimonadetes bacterium]|jgi:sugar-phosphatase|nr:HAD-IA family hydrolase [Gemmatimonadota bacterium]
MQFLREELVSVRANALLFDLDGVLVDSGECVRRVCTSWAIARGLDPELVLRTGHGRRVQETIRAVAPHLDLDREVAELVGIEARTTEGVHPVPGAAELVASLPPSAWAIVTSGARAVATLRLRHVGLPVPQTLITADDVEEGKPHPEGYLAAARALGFAAETCVVVEDAPPGIEAARSAGMRSIGIAGTYPASALVAATVVLPSLGALRVHPLPASRELEMDFVLDI